MRRSRSDAGVSPVISVVLISGAFLVVGGVMWVGIYDGIIEGATISSEVDMGIVEENNGNFDVSIVVTSLGNADKLEVYHVEGGNRSDPEASTLLSEINQSGFKTEYTGLSAGDKIVVIGHAFDRTRNVKEYEIRS